ncbi:hypothetical protein BKA66DRAFT_236324 [Pyrenochaeta sp. MPI-SDFR-AT-0127]|nr:hypothetical protein BKA66DRAFT_236324 [Pyrenochaeta sp. MPI-SDFR-AT-0127]
MSAPTNYGDSRFDSAMSLPLPSSSQLSSTNTSAQHIAATPDDPHSGPWSRFNTRLGYDQAPACRHTEGPTALPDDIDDHASHAPRGYHPHGLEESIASIESRLCLPTYDSSTATTYSSPPSPPLPRPWAAASSATAPSTVSTSKYFESPNIYCGQCGVEFTGVYRRGNLKRHVRQKHTGTKGGPYTCEADGCYRVFARQDARLKHARKHHPGLHPEPVQRRQGHERELTTSQTAQDGAVPSYHSRSNPVLIQSRPNPEAQSSMSPLVAFHTALPSSLDVSSAQWHSVPPQPLTSANRGPSTSYTHGSSTVASSLVFDVGQWLPTPPQISLREGNLGHDARQKLQQEVTSIEVEELPRAARVVFASLHAILDLDTYSRLCDITFARWERLLEQLRNEQYVSPYSLPHHDLTLSSSDAYPVYAKVVEDLYAVIHAIDSGAIDTASEASTAYSASRCRPSHGHQSASRGHEHGISTSGLGARAGLPANNGSKPIGRRASQPNGPGNNAKIIKGTKSKKSEFREVDCPEHKHYMMHRTPQSPTFPPCQGCRETVMAQVRSHLNRVIGHRDFDFVKQCSRCKMDFLDRATFANHDAANTCKHQAQSRRDIRVPWARLYLARYPEATRVPSPCMCLCFIYHLQ